MPLLIFSRACCNFDANNHGPILTSNSEYVNENLIELELQKLECSRWLKPMFALVDDKNEPRNSYLSFMETYS